MNEETPKKNSLNNLSCEAIKAIIKKRKTQELTPRERNAVFEHSIECKDCREINVKILEDLINGKDVNQ